MQLQPAMTGPTQSALELTLIDRVANTLLHRRVRITSFVFLTLVIADAVEQVKPHSLTNLRDYRVLAGLGLIISGLSVRSWAAGTLHKRIRLATTGPYAMVRHPLYLGSLSMMLGFCALVDDGGNFWIALGPIFVLYIFRALHEEKSIAALFPTQWPAYAARVPRFVPRQLPNHMFANWDFNQWLNNREYRAIFAVLLGLAALQTWHLML
jgi:protein-S-isoprenylcysteine O-methyltransferase Ste14